MTTHLPTLAQIRQSTAFYPITGLYLGGVIIALAAAEGWVNLPQALVIGAFLAMLSLLLAAWREVRVVHTLVNSQRTELVARIDTLQALLVVNDVAVPAQGIKEQQARVDIKRLDDAAAAEPAA